MFHCNGWCFPWTVTALAGTHVCLRRVEAGAIFDAIARARRHASVRRADRHEHAGQRAGAARRWHRQQVEMMTAGAAPPAAVIGGIEELGFHVTHVYGLTEVYGPAVVCAWHDEWDALPDDERAPAQGAPGRALPGAGRADGGRSRRRLSRCRATARRMGEIFMRGNIVMKGYLKNPTATEEAFAGGWFHTGDLARLPPRRLCRDQGPLEGHHHLRRREHLDDRGRGRALPPPGGAGSRGRRPARPAMGRDARAPSSR